MSMLEFTAVLAQCAGHFFEQLGAFSACALKGAARFFRRQGAPAYTELHSPHGENPTAGVPQSKQVKGLLYLAH